MPQQKGAKRAVKVQQRKRKIEERRRASSVNKAGHAAHDHEHEHEHEHEEKKAPAKKRATKKKVAAG